MEILLKGKKIEKKFQNELPVHEVCKQLGIEPSCDVVALKEKNEVHELTYIAKNDSKIQLVGVEDIDGYRIYSRSLVFLLLKAIKEVFNEGDIIVRNSIDNGTYCELVGIGEVTKEKVALIEDKMKELVQRNIPFKKTVIQLEEPRKAYRKMVKNKEVIKINDKEKEYIKRNSFSISLIENLIKYTEKKEISIYECDGLSNYFYGYMVPHTGYLNKFRLEAYQKGLVLLCPNVKTPKEIPNFVEQKNLFSVFLEFKEWNSIMNVENVASINSFIENGQIGICIRVAEALQEKKIAQIADMICNSKDKKKIVLIAGPSSSGKTTFSKRLAIQLLVNKKIPVTIGLDDYFLNRSETPLDEDGNLDYESINALDLKLFNENLLDLINGKEVTIPIYNFKTGKREEHGRKMKLQDDSIIVVEGIHGLNEKLTELIDKKDKFKIYISALTNLNLDEHNRIYTTDNRLLRRIVRDNQFRGITAKETIERWHLVRKGEEKNIFPFQENADVIFNSALIYEIFVLKRYATKLLKEIDNSCPEYIEARRLLGFLSYFKEAPIKNIPQHSILKEFIGGSCFDV